MNLYTSVIIGFCFGLAISVFNHILVVIAVKKTEGQSESKIKNAVMSRYLLRYFTNIAALFVVYKNPPMLIATALGLTMVKNYLFIKQILGKKGVI